MNDIIKKDNITYLQTNKYKTNIINLCYLVDSLEDYAALQLLINVMFSGSLDYPSKKDITNYVEDLYDSSLNINFQTYGLRGVISISSTYLMDKYTDIDISSKIITLLNSVSNNPLIKDGSFNVDYINREKSIIKENLLAEFDNKSRYSVKKLTTLNSISEDFKKYVYVTIEDIDSITNEDLIRVYNKYINNDNLLCYVIGEIDLDKFSCFTSKNIITLDSFTRNLDFIPKNEVVEEIKDINQSILTLNYLTNISYLDKSTSRTLSFLNHILGGDSNSLLFRIIREEHNLCYSIYSTYSNFTGSFTIVVGLDDSNVENCINLIDDIINKIINNNYDDFIYDNSKLAIKEEFLEGVDSEMSTLRYEFLNDLFNRNLTIYELINEYDKIEKLQVNESAKLLKKDVTFILRGRENENN